VQRERREGETGREGEGQMKQGGPRPPKNDSWGNITRERERDNGCVPAYLARL
jgi:hypothetical protein